MSGRQIGTVVGFVVGYFFGMPQLGAMIGGMIGNYVSPDVINGPSIGDAQQQTAQAGVPRPVVYGHPAPFAGNIIDGEAKARKIKVKRRDDGKGNQTITKEEHFILTYAIRICEGPIAGIARIWRNGKVVADFRADSMIPPYANGDVSARGMSIAEGRAATIKTMQKVRIYLGTEDQLPDPSLEALHGIGNTPSYRGTAYMVITDDDVTDNQGAAAQWQFEVIGVGAPGGDASVVMESAPFSTIGVSSQVGPGSIVEFRKDFSASALTDLIQFVATISTPAYDRICPVRFIVESVGGVQDGARIYDTGWMIQNLADKLAFESASWSIAEIRDGFTQVVIETLTGSDCVDYVNRFVTDRPCAVTQEVKSGTLVNNIPTASFRVRELIAGRPTTETTPQNGGMFIVQYVLSAEFPASYTMSPDTPGLVIGDDGKLYYPDWDAGSTFPTITPTAITVGAVVDDLANKAGVADSEIDTSALTQPIPGMLVATQCTASEAVKPLQQMYFFDMPEFDGKIRAVQRGGAIKATLTDDDFVYSDGEQTRAQHVEFPLSVTIVTRSPEAEYSPLPQTARRSSNNVTALGESRIESPIPFSPDEGAKRADVIQKVMWARSEGQLERVVPDAWSRLTPSDCVSYQGKRWLIENTSAAEGKVTLKMVMDRAGAYSSTVLAAPIRSPDFPTGNLAEPTSMVVAQMPAIHPDDEGKVGFYVMASGRTDNWRGCTVQISTSNGEYVTDAGQIVMPSDIGALTDSITTSGTPLKVAMSYGELYSVSVDGVASGANAAVIVPDNTIAEIVQNETSTEITPDNYELTGLYRGRLGTGVMAHGIGEKYATIADALFVPMSAEFIGQTIMVRAVTSGTDPSTAPWQTFTLADFRPVQTYETPLFNSDGQAMFNSDGQGMTVSMTL